MWFSFIADSANMLVALSDSIKVPADTPITYVRTLKVFSGNCSGLTLVDSVSIAMGSDSLPVLYDTGYIVGTRYYVSVSKYNVAGCRICNKYPTYFGIMAYGMFSTHVIDSNCSDSCGYEEVCNGHFTHAPLGFPLTYSMGMALPSCGATSGMTYSFGYNGIDGDYAISRRNIPPFFVPTTGPLPLAQPYSFCGNSPDIKIYRVFYNVIAWEQNVPVVPGAHYRLSAYFKDMNPPSYKYPGATLFVDVIQGLLTTNLFTDVISWQKYANWVKICKNWTASGTQTNANLEILDQCGYRVPGYDFMINDISFEMTALPTFTITASPDPICKGRSSTLTISPTVPGYIYTWSPASSLSSSTGTTVTATPTLTTTYTVTISGRNTDSNRCTATARITLVVDSCDSTHSSIKRTSSVSVLNNQNPTFKLYPNPNNGNFTLEYDLGDDVSGTVKFYNIIGELVGEYTLNTSQGKMYIANPKLPNGVYIWKLFTDNQEYAIQVGKTIIMK